MKSRNQIKPRLHPKREKHRRRRYVLMGLGIIALAAAVIYGPALRKQGPNFYNPARNALVNARLRFEQSLDHELALVDQLQQAREELDLAITELGKAADLDPADRAKIEQMRSKLLSMESPDHLEQLGSQELFQSYRDLLAQMEALIADIDEHKKHS